MRASPSNTAEPLSQREILITRVMEVPARLLFLAHSQPEHVLRWFGPPWCPLVLCEMDFRKGGSYRFGMKGADGQRGPTFGGVYLDVIPNQKIVYTNAFEEPGSETMVVTVTFEEENGKTTLSHHTLFASVAQKQSHTQRGYLDGVGASLELLDACAREFT